MSELAALLGVPRDFTFKGRTYKVSRRDLETEAAFEVWLEEQGLHAVKRHRKRLSPEEYERHLDGWRHDCSTGEVYAFTGQISRKSLTGIAGMKRLAWLQLSRLQAVPESLMEEIVDDLEAWQRLLEAMALANGELTDPSTPPPATAAGQAA